MTGAVLADLPLSGARFTRALNGSGDLRATLRLAGLDKSRARDLLDAVDGGRRAIYAEADGQLVWGGPAWSDSDDAPLQVAAKEWGSPLSSMLLLRSRTYTGADQLAIARDLVATAQAEPGGTTIRIALGSEISGVTRDRTYLPGDVPVVGQLLEQLANVDNGFDYAWPVEYDGSGIPRGRLLLGYPRLGAADPAITVEMPRSLGFGRDATQLAVTSYAVGQKPTGGGDVPIASATDPALLDAGYLPLHKVKTYSDVSDVATLQAHADADQQAAGGTATSVMATVGMRDVLGIVNPGDPALCLFQGPRFPDGFEAVLRITQIDYDPGADTCALTLAPRIAFGGRIPTVEDERSRLARLAREVRTLATAT